MTSENAINGYACGSSPRLNGILRAKFNFTGFFTSDCGGISDVANHMGLDEVHAAAAAVTAGNDLECADQDPNPPNGGLYVRYLAKGVADKLVTQEAVDTAVSNVLRVQMELGEFDDPAKVPHKQIGTDQFDSGAHQAVAREAADQSVVLLQNRGGVLPLPKGATLKVAVIGPHGKSTDRLLGEADYATQNNHVGANSLYAVLGRRPGVTVTYAEGCTFSDYCASSKHVAAAVAAAKGADVVVLALGTTACDRSCKKACECESEGHDRHFIDLPGVQPDLVKQVAAAATGTVIGVLVHAGPLAVEPLIDAADAIIDPHNPGQSGMEATVAVMFGDVNPTGREAATVYPSTYVTAERPDMFDMSLRGANQSGMTYQYYAGAALFEFGHGLSFSNFTYEWSPPPPFSAAEIARGAEVTHTVTVTNAAGPAGAASVLGFVAGDGAARPRKKLFDFARTEVIHPGASAIVTLRSSAAAFAAAGVVRPGEYTLLTGDPAGHAACTFRVTGAEHAVAGA